METIERIRGCGHLLNFKINCWSITNQPIIEENVVKIAVFNGNESCFFKVDKRISVFMLVEIVDDASLNELIQIKKIRQNSRKSLHQLSIAEPQVN